MFALVDEHLDEVVTDAAVGDHQVANNVEVEDEVWVVAQDSLSGFCYTS